jgi:hypothetical protein
MKPTHTSQTAHRRRIGCYSQDLILATYSFSDALHVEAKSNHIHILQSSAHLPQVFLGYPMINDHLI